MSDGDQREPFWLTVLVAGAAAFALVALVAMLAIRLGRPHGATAPRRAEVPPEARLLQQAIQAYHDTHGTLPAELDLVPRDPPLPNPPRSRSDRSEA